MQPDPRQEPRQPPKAPSETVANAHAAGDGALERSDDKIEAPGGDDNEELHAEDRDGVPY